MYLWARVRVRAFVCVLLDLLNRIVKVGVKLIRYSRHSIVKSEPWFFIVSSILICVLYPKTVQLLSFISWCLPFWTQTLNLWITIESPSCSSMHIDNSMCRLYVKGYRAITLFGTNSNQDKIHFRKLFKFCLPEMNIVYPYLNFWEHDILYSSCHHHCPL